MIQFYDFIKSDVEFIEEVHDFQGTTVGAESRKTYNVTEINGDVIQIPRLYRTTTA